MTDAGCDKRVLSIAKITSPRDYTGKYWTLDPRGETRHWPTKISLKFRTNYPILSNFTNIVDKFIIIIIIVVVVVDVCFVVVVIFHLLIFIINITITAGGGRRHRRVLFLSLLLTLLLYGEGDVAPW